MTMFCECCLLGRHWYCVDDMWEESYGLVGCILELEVQVAHEQKKLKREIVKHISIRNYLKKAFIKYIVI